MCVSLHLEHLLVAVPVVVVAAAGGFLAGRYLSKPSCKSGQVNTSINKDSPKVVHSFDMEDIATKAVYCRCWKSKKVSQSGAIYICRAARRVFLVSPDAQLILSASLGRDLTGWKIYSAVIAELHHCNCNLIFSSRTATEPTPSTTMRPATTSGRSSLKRGTDKRD